MSDDNKEEATDNVVDMLRARVESAANKKPAAPTPVTGGADIPPPRNFQIVLKAPDGSPGKSLFYSGYLVATGVFVGVSDADGVVLGVVPLDNISFVKEADPADVAATA